MEATCASQIGFVAIGTLGGQLGERLIEILSNGSVGWLLLGCLRGDHFDLAVEHGLYLIE